MSGRSITTALVGTIFKFVILAVVVVGVFRISINAYDFGYRIFAEEPVSEAPGRDVSIAVTDDMSMKDIAKLLKNKGLVRDANLFYFQEKLSEYKDLLKPGVYELNTSMTAEEMLAVMGTKTEEEIESEGSK